MSFISRLSNQQSHLFREKRLFSCKAQDAIFLQQAVVAALTSAICRIHTLSYIFLLRNKDTFLATQTSSLLKKQRCSIITTSTIGLPKYIRCHVQAKIEEPVKNVVATAAVPLHLIPSFFTQKHVFSSVDEKKDIAFSQHTGSFSSIPYRDDSNEIENTKSTTFQNYATSYALKDEPAIGTSDQKRLDQNVLDQTIFDQNSMGSNFIEIPRIYFGYILKKWHSTVSYIRFFAAHAFQKTLDKTIQEITKQIADARAEEHERRRDDLKKEEKGKRIRREEEIRENLKRDIMHYEIAQNRKRRLFN